MSSGQQRGRGGRGADRGGPKSGDSRGGRGDGSSRGGDRGGSRGRESRGGRGDGQRRGGSGDRGGGRGRGYGGPPVAGQTAQLPSHGPPPGSGSGGIFIGPAPAPDPTITAAEDALVAKTRGLTIDGFPGRRSFGIQGKRIVLRTNYFKINTTYDSNDATISEQILYRYDVDTSNTQLSRQKRRRLMELIVGRGRFRDLTWATDYANMIVTTEQLDLGQSNEWRETVTIPPIGGDTQATGQGSVPDVVQDAQARNRVTFRVTCSDSFSLQHLIEYLRSDSTGAEYQGRVDLIQLLNIIMCKSPQAQPTVANVGQNKFYPFEGHPGMESYAIGGALEALRGYFASVRPSINRLLVNINVTSGAFYKPVALIDLLNESGLYSNEHKEAFIRMLKVKAVYKKDKDSEPHMTKIKTVVGFAKQLDPPTFHAKRFGNAKEVKFRYVDRSVPNAQPQNISVFDYFRREREITLQNPGLPVLNVGTRADPQYLPQELCTVLPGQPYRRILGGEQTSVMIKFAARAPNLNAMSIAGTQGGPGNGLRLFRLADPPSMQDPQLESVKPFGFSVDAQMITVPGRILDPPRVSYGNNKTVNPQRGSWNFANQRFAIPGRHGKWQVWVINRAGPRGNALIDRPQGNDMFAPEDLFGELQRNLGGYGLTMGQRLATQTISLSTLDVSNRNSNDRQIREAYQRADEQEVRLVFIVLPEQDRWLYARIKYHGDCEFGIHSINAIGRKLQNPKGQGMFMGNLALKFNIKGGGVSHKVPNIFTEPLNNNTMLVGIDVTHPSPGSSPQAPSIACIVASIDEHLFQWPGSIRAQTGRREMVEGLEDMVVERLELWRRKHNRLPGNIVIYRDGVSEGQYSLVLEHEVPPFEKAFSRLYGQDKNWPKLVVVVVGKRHHTRFYPTKQDEADFNPKTQKGSWNPLPGTVVDRGIVGRNMHELYLQAHQGLQGTARPAHYVVIKDEIGFEGDQLEQFTHKMCYTFNRATKAVSICPPAYYADLLCERGRCYLFSTLAENHASDSSVYSDGGAEWTAGVHERLKDSTWYI